MENTTYDLKLISAKLDISEPKSIDFESYLLSEH